MAKYKNLKPEIIEGFLDKVFGSVVKNRANATINKIAKKDKTFAKNYATLKKLRNKVERDLKARGVDLDDEVDDILARFDKLKR